MLPTLNSIFFSISLSISLFFEILCAFVAIQSPIFNALVYIVCARRVHFKNFSDKTFHVCLRLYVLAVGSNKETSIEVKLCGKQESIITSNFAAKKLFGSKEKQLFVILLN